jgi:hypothetical protein
VQVFISLSFGLRRVDAIPGAEGGDLVGRRDFIGAASQPG